MIGFRGASRYIADSFRPCFALECEAMKRVRDVMGLTNVEVMIPFVRTLGEAEQVVEILAENGLRRGERGLKVIMMCELPSNALLADKFLEHFDGFSIGSNDMTQLTLGWIGTRAHRPPVRRAQRGGQGAAGHGHRRRPQGGKYVGICGQGPSDHPDFAAWLVEQGIDSVSLNPDTVVDTWLYLAEQHKAG
jgi:pyruvate,water dikinase